MDLEVRWQSPFNLLSSKSDLIYEVQDFESVPETPGVLRLRPHARRIRISALHRQSNQPSLSY